MPSAAFGFGHFPVGPGREVLLVYGEAVYRAVCKGGLGLHRFAAVALPGLDRGDDAALLALLRKLKSRAVVIWPPDDDENCARALRHAALLVDAGAAAVGIVETPDDFEREEAGAYADAALRAALARALPASADRPARAVMPWTAALDAGAMFAQACALLARALAAPQAVLDTIALWCLHTWFVQSGAPASFDISPRLVFQANDPRADHARALRVAAWLTPSPLIVSRTIAAHLLPVIEAERPTLLLDDVGGGLLYRRDMRTLIAAGAMRDGTFLSARTRRNRSGRASCFAPAAIATMGSLPDDVRMRAIVVPVAPAPVGDTRTRMSLSEPPDGVADLRAQMQAFAAQMRGDLGAVEAAMPRKLSAGARESWYPLIALAYRIGARAGRRAVEAAEALADIAPPPASNLALLGDIRECFGVDAKARIPTTQLIEALTADPERPWASGRRGRKIDARELAERLGAFGVKPVSLRMPDDVVLRGYRGEDLADAFARYLNDATAATSSGNVAAA